ncbi:hypothetical protein SCHPADRAFT_686415 [Schizopora paradoxa]|uniref:Uncharacterized protein n=1 Tax=Schizopora paradoxa TaxID=27342 RepID=A0A0H2RP41_9AGAM|nr:hypothetical protein SCHPADRAFT_686415 [Schizopora paradoxa]
MSSVLLALVLAISRRTSSSLRDDGVLVLSFLSNAPYGRRRCASHLASSINRRGSGRMVAISPPHPSNESIDAKLALESDSDTLNCDEWGRKSSHIMQVGVPTARCSCEDILEVGGCPWKVRWNVDRMNRTDYFESKINDVSLDVSSLIVIDDSRRTSVKLTASIRHHHHQHSSFRVTHRCHFCGNCREEICISRRRWMSLLG